MRGNPLGRELVTFNRDQSGITITTQGRMLAPLNITVRNAEFKYLADWTPTTLSLDATVNDSVLQLKTTFANGKAATDGVAPGQPISATHDVAPKTLIHVNGVFGSYVALARRLVENSEEGAEFRVYVVPQIEIAVKVKAIHRERMQVGTTVLDVRRFELVYANPSGEVAVNLTANDDGGLVRVNVPVDSLDIVREDVASTTSRTQIHSNPGDEAVIIPALGFNIGATLTRPVKSAPNTKLATVVLVAGSGVGDRDGVVHGVPTLAQLAGAIADSGMMAVRYDKRGNGQSGGRSESATVTDFAEDVRAIVRWLEKRPDIDPKRIAVAGHSEGAWIGLLAASRERRIAAVVSIAGPASRGAELILEQQRYSLDQLKLPVEEREDSTLQRIAGMNVAKRIALAMKGTREERAILIRDPNRIVTAAVLSSPKMTETEIAAIARMANVSEDVLRTICNNRAWLKNSAVALSLVKTPKTPVALSMNLLARLNDKDLRMMSTDRNIPDALRVTARKKAVIGG